MHEDGKISIIVPVFMVEDYLDDCVESIVKQTYPKLEIILVDDSSTDACGVICDRWAKKDKRIRAIHKAHGGLSDARNVGLDTSTGEFIGFVDSDDYIEYNMYEILLKKITQTESDIASCGVKMVYENGCSKVLTPSEPNVLSNFSAMKSLIEDTWIRNSVWNKLYKREVIDGIKFKFGKCHEDVFWTYQVIANSRKVVCVERPMYYYRQRPGSIMADTFSGKRLDYLEALEERLLFLRREYPELAYTDQNNLFNKTMYFMQLALKTSEQIPDVKDKLCCYAKKYPLIPKDFKNIIWKFLSDISFEETCKIRNFFGIGL